MDDRASVHQLPVQQVTDRPAPRRIVRPCEYDLMGTLNDMESQLGTVEAYNRLCDAAAAFKRKIDSGQAKPQMAMFATDPKFIYPNGGR